LRTSYDNITGYTLGYIGLPRTSDFTRVFHPHVDWELRSGMAFHMYTSAAGLAFSETILITDDGHERLTLSPRTLLER
jgi:Xaa-Pro dipeptidase